MQSSRVCTRLISDDHVYCHVRIFHCDFQRVARMSYWWIVARPICVANGLTNPLLRSAQQLQNEKYYWTTSPVCLLVGIIIQTIREKTSSLCFTDTDTHTHARARAHTHAHTHTHTHTHTHNQCATRHSQ